MYCLASLIMAPHSASPGGTPSPRNVSEAAVRMPVAMRSPEIATTDPAMFGSRCRARMRAGRAPSARALWTKSRVIRPITSARAIRA